MSNELHSVRGSVTITKSDVDTFTASRAVLVDTAGNVKVTYIDGLTDTVYLVAGMWHPMQVTMIWSTGTTATGLHVGY